VAAVAGGRFEQVIVAHVAGNAGRRRGHVRSRQGKGGNAVIERHRVPAQRAVAIGTVPGQESRSGCTVHWVAGLTPFCQMAARVSTSAWGDL
jgi:hypothetical protein